MLKRSARNSSSGAFSTLENKNPRVKNQHNPQLISSTSTLTRFQEKCHSGKSSCACIPFSNKSFPRRTAAMSLIISNWVTYDKTAATRWPTDETASSSTRVFVRVCGLMEITRAHDHNICNLFGSTSKSVFYISVAGFPVTSLGDQPLPFLLRGKFGTGFGEICWCDLFWKTNIFLRSEISQP